MCEDVLDIVGLPDYFLDGFTNYVLIDGILRCTGYRKQATPGGVQIIPVVNLMVTPAGAIEARAKAFEALHTLGQLPDITVSRLRRVN